MIPFDARLAWWQTRGQSARFVLFLLCVALGVGARAAIGTFLGRFHKTLATESRNLLTADIEISKNQPFTAEEIQKSKNALPRGSILQEQCSFVSMATARAQSSRLVEVLAVESGYPLHGRLELSDITGKSGDSSLLAGSSLQAFVQPELLAQLSIAAGDTLRLGRADFVIAGIIVREPGQGAGIFSLGPRVLIARKTLPLTGLVESGSRIHYSLLASLPDPLKADEAARAMRTAWNLPPDRQGVSTRFAGPADGISVLTAREKQFMLRRFFERVGDYLRLVSLLALILGGIGVGGVVRGFVLENAENIAVLRSLGASGARIARVYFIQILGMAFLGSVCGASSGVLIADLFPRLFAGFLPVSVEGGVNWTTAGWSILMGMIASAYFGGLPILEIHSIKPLHVFRGQTSGSLTRSPALGFAVLGAALMAGAAVLESRSVSLGLAFGGIVLAGGFLILWGGKLILPNLRLIKPFLPGVGARHGLSNLARPGLRPLDAVLALGLASLLLGILILYQTSLLKELDPGRAEKTLPDFFIIDIQNDQTDDLKQFFSEHRLERVRLSPMVRARYRRLNDQTVDFKPKTYSREGETEQRMRNREQNLSYREALGDDEILLKGHWISPTYSGTEASLEEWFAKQIGANLGDTLEFDVQGVPLKAKVTSIRKVRWSSFQPNFFILMTPSALEGAPKTWVASVAGVPNERRTRLQTELVAAFPNLTLFDVAQAGKRILSIVDRVVWAVRFMALFAVGAGLVVLVGIALSTARQRRVETVLLKTLGAGRRTLAVAAAVEFGLLGGVAAALGLALSALFGWLLLERYFELPFVMPWEPMALTLIILTLLCAATGVAACARLFNAKPLELLREI